MRFRRFKYMAFFLLVSTCKFSYAQYSGGSGFGNSDSYSAAIALTTNTLSSGGIGDGFSANTIPALSLNSAIAGFAGGNGDGFSANTISALSLNAAANGYAGGNGDGFTNNSVSAVVLGIAGTGYSGGNGDGFSNNSVSVLPLIAGANGYSGGNGDGFANNSVSAVSLSTAGTGYSGGNGQGFTAKLSASQSFGTGTMFSGGNDDGFSSALAIYSYVFNGTGNWTSVNNWQYFSMPPASLPANSQIIINPTGATDCILDTPQIILPGGKITIMPGKVMKVVGSLVIQ
jgi:hypothetical protein